jgi:hypothetical protein
MKFFLNIHDYSVLRSTIQQYILGEFMPSENIPANTRYNNKIESRLVLFQFHNCICEKHPIFSENIKTSLDVSFNNLDW